MPKRKVEEAEEDCLSQGRSRRAASKEALKLMQKVLKDEEPLEMLQNIPIKHYDDNSANDQLPPKKKYKVTQKQTLDGQRTRNVLVLKSINNNNNNSNLPEHKKVFDGENTLELECWVEELSDVQKKFHKKYSDENDLLLKKIEELLLVCNANSVNKVEIRETSEINSSPPQSTVNHFSPRVEKMHSVLDKKIKTPGTSKVASKESASKLRKIVPKKQLKSVTTDQQKEPPVVTNNSSLSLTTKEGEKNKGLALVKRLNIVDLMEGKKGKNSSPFDSKEVAISNLLNKNYPSLVVMMKPLMPRKKLISDKEKLNTEIKKIIQLSPTELTEWFLREGLLCSNQTCPTHGTRFDYKSQCELCPEQQPLSVYDGSFFALSPYPPVVIVKLLYHWVCQTPIHLVKQWVGVEARYVKAYYKWLRAVCALTLRTNFKQFGCQGLQVDVSVIPLQNDTQNHPNHGLLGIHEMHTNRMRFCVVNKSKQNKHASFDIIKQLKHYVNPLSSIMTDCTIDRTVLLSAGFKRVTQVNDGDVNNCNGNNALIRNYLDHIVTGCFKNTLSLLSPEIIEQFLNELVWREMYATNVLKGFKNLTDQIAKLTLATPSGGLIEKLNRTANDPFEVSLITTKKVEQLVPLENYYYGTIPGVPTGFKQRTISCGLCNNKVLSDAVALMKHLFTHVHEELDSEPQFCQYCLTMLPQKGSTFYKHLKTKHPLETKLNNLYRCWICEAIFKSPFMLGRHMSNGHCNLELPFRCGGCTFRCSNHRQVVDHFHEAHKCGDLVQCPFCLECTKVFVQGLPSSDNMGKFVRHLRKHQDKRMAERCDRCSLWFVEKTALEEHKSNMHLSQRGKPGLIPGTTLRHCLMVPKSKLDIKTTEPICNIAEHPTCKECNKTLPNPIKHFTRPEKCLNKQCKYVTCCLNALKMHKKVCKTLASNIPVETLPYKMFCACGFYTLDGNLLARHLVICGKKSAHRSKKNWKTS